MIITIFLKESAMNKDIIQGILGELIGNIKQKWGHFTDNNTLKMKGFYQAYYGVLQKKSGYVRDKAQRRMQRLLKEKRRNARVDKHLKNHGKNPALRIVFHRQEQWILQK
jgi:uncharacterized protein YjbJ (UPF0337 family)